MGLLDQMLIQGDDSLLHEELVKKRGYTGNVSGGINAELGDMFDYYGPMLWTTDVIHDPSVKPDQILASVDSIIDGLQSRPDRPGAAGPEFDKDAILSLRFDDDVRRIRPGQPAGVFRSIR